MLQRATVNRRVAIDQYVFGTRERAGGYPVASATKSPDSPGL
jgi:hypothetical protein